MCWQKGTGEVMEKWEYCTMEWLWDNSSIRLNLPDGREVKSRGGYPEVTTTLTTLGASGWEVATCVAVSNWLFWTLKRRV